MTSIVIVSAARTTVVRDAWQRGQPLAVHGWCYGLKDGLVKDLGVTVTGLEQVRHVYEAAIGRYPRAAASASGA